MVAFAAVFVDEADEARATVIGVGCRGSLFCSNESLVVAGMTGL